MRRCSARGRWGTHQVRVTGSGGKSSKWARGQESGESQVSPPVDSGWRPNTWAGSLGSRYAD